jgi:uncharacterized protein YdaL
MFTVCLVSALSCAGGGPDSEGGSEVARPHPSRSASAPSFHERAGGGVSNTFPIVRGTFSRDLQQSSESPPSVGVPDVPVPGVTGRTPLAVVPTTTLVLYDDTGTWGWLGELYAIGAQTLATHFGTVTSKPVSQYKAGDIAANTATIYLGSTFDQPLPTAFLDDVLLDVKPVVWIDDNIWELAARSPTFATTYGYLPYVFDTTDVAAVKYKGATLTRYLPNGAGIMTYSTLDTAKAQVLATAVRANGTTFPWALRSKKLTYIGENPFAFISANDRYLAFCDILFDALAPTTPERHRALVRIEDVDATADPATLRAIADYMASVGVPFSVATIPVYQDPRGVYNGGVPETIRMRNTPQVVNALNYMVSKGGTIVMHGYTHQYSNVKNPYTGVSADDFEFYRSIIDANDYVVYVGPVPGDTQLWASGRIKNAFQELAAARLPTPTIFEYPHYAGSDADSRAVRASFATVYHRGIYFGGTLAGTTPNYQHAIQLFLPYTTKDVYGFNVIPENLGNYEPEPSNHNSARLVPDLLATAAINRVIRDGVASFFFHPYYDIALLKQLVQGIKNAGYTFVAPSAL